VARHLNYLVAIFAWILVAAGGCLPANAQSFAYVANQDFNVSAYTINSTTGAFSQLSGSPFLAGSFPSSVAIAVVNSTEPFATFNSGMVGGILTGLKVRQRVRFGGKSDAADDRTNHLSLRNRTTQL
jgi:hypothetical protein